MPFAHDTLLIASGNKGKIKEIEALLAPYPVAIRSTAEFSLQEPEENADDFVGNASIKAKYYGQSTGLPALADDSGLVIPSLDGKPGIYSARWAGPNKDFSLAMERIQNELYAAHGGEYTINDPAYFVCVLALYHPDSGKVESFEGRVEGHLQFPPQGEKGFGYDPIFVPNGFSESFAQMNGDQKQAISHRAQAFSAFIAQCFTAETV